jgi:hypothetical protein
MRKNTLIVASVAALIFFGIGCDTIVTLDKPNVTTAAINDGGTLRLSWAAITDAKQYEITTAESVFTTTALTYDLTTPTKSVEVRAVNGSDKSDPFVLSLAVKTTPTITVYGRSDTASSHPSGFGFSSDGTAVPYSLTNQATSIDYVMDDVGTFGTGMWVTGPTGYQTPVNPWGNAIQSSATGYDELAIAPAPGNYDLYLQIAVNGTYTAWLDHNDDGVVDATDHFAKIKVESVDGAIVTLKLAYQAVGGLRWLVE